MTVRLNTFILFINVFLFSSSYYFKIVIVQKSSIWRFSRKYNLCISSGLYEFVCKCMHRTEKRTIPSLQQLSKTGSIFMLYYCRVSIILKWEIGKTENLIFGLVACWVRDIKFLEKLSATLLTIFHFHFVLLFAKYRKTIDS